MDEKKKRLIIIAVVVACVGLGGLFLLGIIAGIAVPAWLSSVRTANETVAIRTIKTIVAEEQSYLSGHDKFATFDQLIEADALDKRFVGESPVVDHYVYRLKVIPRTASSSPAFTVDADPERSGRRHFYWDSGRPGIHYSEDRPATADDPVLESP